MEECRPCTDDELLLSACSMDFAVSGKMASVLNSNILEQTTITVKVDKIYRQKGRHFTVPRENSRSRRDIARQSEESAELDADESGYGTIVAPYKCGIRYGEGDFLFIGRMRLGRALLQCAPRMEDFSEMWKKAARTGHNQCNLD